MAEYIEREKTVELLRSLGNREYRKEKGTIQDAIKMISYQEYTPAANVAPVIHGRWLRADDFVICSQCEAEMNQKNSLGVDNFKNYCPNCGARMDGNKNG